MTATTPLSTHPKALIIWLIACLLLVTCMVLVGGYTRLSGSGLSITEWKPIHGSIPPLSAVEWEEEFAAYRESPQYIKVNHGMTLDEFKGIFWPEFLHRLLGRIIGLAFFLPFLFFLARGNLSRRMSFRLLGIFALGGLQGLIGWLMVKSGLVDNPQVSPYRLALHLGTAFFIFALIYWTILDILAPWEQHPRDIPTKTVVYFKVWMGFLIAQIILGALVAGMRAGLVYNTWPTMNGQWIPENLMHDAVTLVQFSHRTLALLLIFSFAFWWYSQRKYVKKRSATAGGTIRDPGVLCLWLFGALIAQVALGIYTLLSQVQLNPALWHQFCALAVLAVALSLLHALTTLRVKAR